MAAFTPVTPKWIAEGFRRHASGVGGTGRGAAGDRCGSKPPRIAARSCRCTPSVRGRGRARCSRWRSRRPAESFERSSRDCLWITRARRRAAARAAQRAREPRRPPQARRGSRRLCSRAEAVGLGRRRASRSRRSPRSTASFACSATCSSKPRLLWSLYLALEPYGRRFWPDGLLGWTRLFSGLRARSAHRTRDADRLRARWRADDPRPGSRLRAQPDRPARRRFRRPAATQCACRRQQPGRCRGWISVYGSFKPRSSSSWCSLRCGLVVRRTWIAVAVGVVW